jgi:ankyrin repeat protein
VDQASAKGETALMMAAFRGQLDLARELIARGAQVNRSGWTPLHYAATNGHVAMIEYLLTQKADINAPSPNETTPLMMAAMYGSEDAARALLKAGADPARKNQLGMTAADFARKAERTRLADALARAAGNGR